MNLAFKNRELRLICLIMVLFISIVPAQRTLPFKTGADQPELYLPLLRDRRVALVTNQTGRLADGTFIADFLIKQNIRLIKIFAPEHGFRGDADAGELVQNGIDVTTGLPLLSLYGKNKKPSADQLSDIDVVLFDIQDVGVRFYTYISTLSYVMEACAENNKKIIVLDRPNPNDGFVDGPVLKKEFSSFVGLHQVPVVYGLTIGEYGKMVNGEKWLKGGKTAEYTVIPMLNYHKAARYALSASPSPNLPTANAVNLYPSLCLFEGTEVSVGRGTPFPFEVYGSPFTRSLPFRFTPQPNERAKEPFQNGKLCYGEKLTGRTQDLRKLDLSWLLKAFGAYEKPKNEFFLKNLYFDKLAGSSDLRQQILAGKTEEEIRKSWKKDLAGYERIRTKYTIYPN